MRVVFENDAVQDERCFVALDNIAYLVANGWHVWEVDDPESIGSSPWLTQGRQLLRDLLEQRARSSAFQGDRSRGPHLRRVRVRLEPEAEEDHTPGQANSLLSSPLRVLMENRFTDGIFVDAVLEHLGSEVLRDLLSIQPPPLEKDSPGGNGELPRLIEDYVARAGKNGIHPRVVVFADSDGRIPEQVSENARRVAETCVKHRIPCMVLEKRAIENYIPDQVLHLRAADPSQRAKLLPKVEALSRLTRSQRDHFPMKKGFKGVDRPDEKDLFEGVPEDDREQLRNGFGTRIIQVLRDKRDSLAAQLRERDGRDELDRLVAMIADQL